MTIHFFTFSDAKGGSSRQRAFRVAEELQKRGMDVVIHWPPVLLVSRTPWPQKFSLIVATVRALFSIKKGDVVYLQRAIANKYFFVIMVAYLTFFRRKMIFDFDDPVYVHTPFKTKTFAKMADVVITCTHGQAEWARRFSNNVHIFHILVDFPVYQKFTKDYTHQSDTPVIGWVGTGPEHIHNLEIIVPVFKRMLVEKKSSFKFVLVGALKNKDVYGLFQSISGLEVEFIDSLDWTNQESVPRVIQTFDIGVLPHQSNGIWNENKTSLKNLEYMACGVATICSNFGEMPHVIADGVNGYLARNENEWVEKLEDLLSNQALCIRIGRAGQENVRERYSFDADMPRLIKLINSMSESIIE